MCVYIYYCSISYIHLFLWYDYFRSFKFGIYLIVIIRSIGILYGTSYLLYIMWRFEFQNWMIVNWQNLLSLSTRSIRNYIMLSSHPRDIKQNSPEKVFFLTKTLNFFSAIFRVVNTSCYLLQICWIFLPQNIFLLIFASHLDDCCNKSLCSLSDARIIFSPYFSVALLASLHLQSFRILRSCLRSAKNAYNALELSSSMTATS